MKTAAVRACKQPKSDHKIHPNRFEFLDSLDQCWHTYTNRGWQVHQSAVLYLSNAIFTLEILIP
jgi:hypothetical protein